MKRTKDRAIYLFMLLVFIFFAGCAERRPPGQAVCGDGICSASEGENESNCPLDCLGGRSVKCGNGVCDSGENFENCPRDCGLDQRCGNGVCDESTENNENCPQDCEDAFISKCGNLFCEPGENMLNCPRDCRE